MSMLPSQEVIQSELAPYEARFIQIIMDAWSQYRLFQRNHSLRFPRSRANVIWDWIAQGALEEFSGVDGISVTETDQTVWFRLSEAVVFRFKKADADGYSRNFPTQSALAFVDPQQDVFGLAQAACVDVVYILDPSETEIQDIRIVLRNNNRMEWQYSILLSEQVTLMPKPVEAAPEAPRVVIKIADDQVGKASNDE